MTEGNKSGMSIGLKVTGIVGFCIFSLIMVSGYAIIQMKEIGAEIEAVAEQDMPLTEILSKITTHQLEQSLNLERAARYGEEMASSNHGAISYKKAVEKFESYSGQVNSEILTGEELAEEAVGNAHSEEEKAEFVLVLDGLKKIEVAHTEFETHAREVFALIEAGKIEEAIELEEKVEIETEELNHELEALLTELEHFTSAALFTVEHLEQATLRNLIILTLVMLALAISCSFLLIRKTIANPMKSITLSLDNLLAGDTSTPVKSHSNDEIGKIAQALEVFREKLIENHKLQDEAKEQQ